MVSTDGKDVLAGCGRTAIGCGLYRFNGPLTPNTLATSLFYATSANSFRPLPACLADAQV